MKFPTLKEFLAWWDNQSDFLSRSPIRNRSCPIARYLKQDGASVDVEKTAYWIDGSVMPLPEWATDFVFCADRAVTAPLNVSAYRGLPPGFDPAKYLEEE